MSEAHPTFVCTVDEFMAATPMERRKLVLAQIDANPELHDQDHWEYKGPACETTRCAAGWACVLAGRTFVHEGFHAESAGRLSGRHHDPMIEAAKLLGLGIVSAEHAFLDAETRDEVARVFDKAVVSQRFVK